MFVKHKMKAIPANYRKEGTYILYVKRTEEGKNHDKPLNCPERREIERYDRGRWITYPNYQKDL